MNSRETILARIREALLQKAVPRHGSGLPSLIERHSVLPLAPTATETQLALFAENAVELKTDFRYVSDDTQLLSQLKTIATEENWRLISTHRSARLSTLATQLGANVVFTDGGYDKDELERCDAGITECDALVAQTGSVLLTNRSAGGRALSCLPPHHIVVASTSQLVPDLSSAMELLREK